MRVCVHIDKHDQAMISHYFCIKNTIEKRIICWWYFVLLRLRPNAGPCAWFMHFPASLTAKTCNETYDVKINLRCQLNQPTHLVLCSFTGNLVCVSAVVLMPMLNFVYSHLLFFVDFHITELCAHSHTAHMYVRSHIETKWILKHLSGYAYVFCFMFFFFKYSCTNSHIDRMPRVR